jgi:hypothetical protein
VLRGAMRLLERDRPIILSEVHPTQLERASRTDAWSLLSLVRELGYHAHHVENGALGPALETVPADALVSIALVPTD